MTIEEIRQKAEEMAALYNPEGLSPFPFENILKAHSDLRLLLNQNMPDDNLSGVAGFMPEKGVFVIIVNGNRSSPKRHFIAAHALGHYFLHREQAMRNTFNDKDSIFESIGVSQLRDELPRTRFEIEANAFAISLLMPAGLVKRAWEKLHSVQECAELFSVPLEAMAVRLTRLGLVN